eukprot:1963922-Amphidinium_carterae.1
MHAFPKQYVGKDARVHKLGGRLRGADHLARDTKMDRPSLRNVPFEMFRLTRMRVRFFQLPFEAQKKTGLVQLNFFGCPGSLCCKFARIGQARSEFDNSVTTSTGPV